MQEKIKDIMASVFEIEISEITAEASPDTLSEWTSLKHMNLVMALEEEFEITLSEEEMIEMMSFPEVKSIVEQKLA